MGPLTGAKIIEIAGLGPGPFAGMMLADMGAEVIRVERIGGGLFDMMPHFDFLNRNKTCIALNLKSEAGVATLFELLKDADALIEGFRPGVMERLGIGPDECLAVNPKLVYGRMTGWGQDGPLAQRAGHDINYISLTGALYHIGEQGEKPTIPLSLVGDFGGGAMFLAFGLACALWEAGRSGKGQVVDAAMIDGASMLMSPFYAGQQIGFWKDERGTNILDGGAHYYQVYETSDQQYVSVGPVESQFYAELLEKLELNPDDLPDQNDEAHWPELKEKFSEIFKTRSRDQWCEVFEGSDACFCPILSIAELREHPHHQHRESYVELDGAWHPAPAPRFSRTKAELRSSAVSTGANTDEILKQAGFSEQAIQSLREQAVIN